jgi:Protein of unknown function (DUF1488)
VTRGAVLGTRQRDGASFFVGEDALRRVQPDLQSDEAGFLGAFEANRDLIYATAAKIYMRGAKAPTTW